MGNKPNFLPNQQLSNSFSVPAPIGGLNVADSIAAMPPTDAILLRNFWPESFGCSVRPGYREHSSGLNGDVCTIMFWAGQAGTNKVFAVDQSNIFDVSAGGPVGAAIRVSTDPYWQFTDFANPAGTHLIAFNGKDNGFWYSNAGAQQLILGDGVASGTWKNVDPKNLIQVTAHQKRIWAVEKGTTKGWYLPPEQVYGVASAFDFGSNFLRGGYLQQLITWSTDNGAGSDDHLIAISSGGDVVVYAGIDPSDSTKWALQGVYYCGGTFSRRCATRIGGDVAILSQAGVFTMGSLLVQAATLAVPPDFSRKVQPLLSNLATAGSARKQWQVLTHLTENMLIINVPGLVTADNQQYVWNSITKAWTQFTMMAAACWMSTPAVLYMGGTGKVYRAWEGVYDNVAYDGTGGAPVQADCQQAFSYFGTPGKTKHYKMVRPTFITEGGSTFKIGINTDFKFDAVPSPSPIVKTAYGLWDVSFWDQALWSGGALTDQPWVFVVGIGFAASLRVRVDASSATIWAATDWILEPGGPV